MRSPLALALVLALAPVAARAQEADAPDEAAKEGGSPARAPGDEVRPVGAYSGVAEESAPAAVRVGKPGKHPRVLWIGFRVADGGGRLFVQLDRGVEATQAVVGDKLVIGLGDAVLTTRNARRALDVRYFGSTAARVTPTIGTPSGKKGRRRGRALALEISFKDAGAASQASASQGQGKDGLAYLYFDFPSGAPSKEPTRPEVEPTATKKPAP
jgi:hypothetical protein